VGIFSRVLIAPVTSQSVLPIYRVAADRWQAELPLYDAMYPLDVYRNPPAFAAYFSWLGGIPDRFLAVLWRAVGLVLFATGFWRLWQALGSPAPQVPFVFAALQILPALNNGQVNLYIAGGAVWAAALIAEQRVLLAGVFLGFIIMLKIYPLALAGLYVVQGRFRLFASLVLVLLVCFGLPFLLQNQEYVVGQHVYFVTCSLSDDRSEASITRAPRDWSIIVRGVSGVIVPRSITTVTAMMIGVAMASLAWRNRDQGVRLPLALGLCWMTLFGPATESNTYSFLAPMALLVIRPDGRYSWRSWLGFAGLFWIIFSGLLPRTFADRTLLIQPLSACILLVEILILTLRVPKPIPLQTGLPASSR
jgi:hypothetical protein